MNIEPCPKCGATDINFTNCGYSAFDCASAECKKCGHKIGISGSDARNSWNSFKDSPKSRMFYHWLLSKRQDAHRPSSSEVVKAAQAIYENQQDMLNDTNYSI